METALGYIPFKDFNLRYKLIRKCRDTLLGDATLYKDKTIHKTVIVKEKDINSQIEFDREIKACELVYKLNNITSFTKLYGYTYRISQINQENSCTLYEIREHVDNDLEKEIANRLRTQVTYTSI